MLVADQRDPIPVPMFVLYDSGAVITAQRAADFEGPWSFRSFQLTRAEVDRLLARLSPAALETLPAKSEGGECLDVPAYRLLWTDSHGARRESVFIGDLEPRGTPEVAECSHAPPAFRHAFEVLTEFSGPGEREWTPSATDLVLVRFSAGSQVKGAPWPGGWPPPSPHPLCPYLNSEERVARLQGWSYPQVVDALKQEGTPGGTFVLSGEDWGAWVHPVLPLEEQWRCPPRPPG